VGSGQTTRRTPRSWTAQLRAGLGRAGFVQHVADSAELRSLLADEAPPGYRPPPEAAPTG